MQILVKHDTITPKLRQLSGFFKRPEQFSKICSQAMLADTQDYYAGKGGKFWSRFPAKFEDTHLERLPRISVVGYDAAVLIHKRDGGTAYPKPPNKRLAIPTRNNPDREKWPSMYADGELVPVFGRKGIYGLASRRMMDSIKRTTASLRGKAKSAAIERLRTFAQLFTLVASATHRPDPDALPPPERTMKAVEASALDAVAEVIRAPV